MKAAPRNGRPSEIFISYSSEDRDCIGPIIQLVRVLKGDSVFQDFASIRPGEKWADAIWDALAVCRTVLVFWCEHSAASAWVREEYEAAIRTQKEVIPILLDNTAVPERLAAYQCLDFRKPEKHGGIFSFVPSEFRRSKRHFYPKDKYGEYRDWDYEDHAEKEMVRLKEWQESQKRRSAEVARAIVDHVAKLH